MPNINEEPYKVLYDGDGDSRPNTPVNILVGAIILKELKSLPNDDAVRENAALDLGYKYALFCENVRNAPFSDNALSRFRQKVARYRLEAGIDLLYNTFIELRNQIAGLMKADKSMVRIDSTYFETWAKYLTRNELLYMNNEMMIESLTGYKVHKRRPKNTGIAMDPDEPAYQQLCLFDQEALEEEDPVASFDEARAKELENTKALIPESLHAYLSTGNKNIAIYHDKDSYDEKARKILSHSKELTAFIDQHPRYKELAFYSSSFAGGGYYQTYTRVLNEQCKVDDDGIYILKEKDEGMH